MVYKPRQNISPWNKTAEWGPLLRTQREGCDKKQNGVFVVKFKCREKNSTRINTSSAQPM